MPVTTLLAPAKGLTISVVVPSYGRPDELAGCLEALGRQNRAAEEVVVVTRKDDVDTLAVCGAACVKLNLRAVCVGQPGMVAALNAGRQVACGDVIAITDDDAQPEVGWLAQIEAIMKSDETIGAVGGPDLVAGATPIAARPGRVGRITWYGRMFGNHHAGVRREDVDFLKGVNMAYRAQALEGFDERLRGTGAQVGNDMHASLAVRQRGYRVAYDPLVRVRHYPGRRAEGDGREHRGLRKLRDHHHNETYTVAATLPTWRATLCIAYSFVIGYRSAPGIAHWILRLLGGPGRVQATYELAAVACGRVEGLMTAGRAASRRRLSRWTPQ